MSPIRHQTKGTENLLHNSDEFGVSIGDDAATIDRIPLMNIILSSPGNPSLVMDVVDTTKHCETVRGGGKKDAPYI